jgi:hypothetical protein
MAFTKSFPKKIAPNLPPVWEEIALSEQEEKDIENKCKRQNYFLLDECLQASKSLAIKHSINTDENRTKIAIALFEKLASHSVFFKERAAKEKFEKLFNKNNKIK